MVLEARFVELVDKKWASGGVQRNGELARAVAGATGTTVLLDLLSKFPKAAARIAAKDGR